MHGALRIVVFSGCAAVLVGCGEPNRTPVDGEVRADGGDALDGGLRVAPPAAPELGAAPEGFAPAVDAIGPACPAGDFAEALPDDGRPVVYVRAGGGPGDGSIGSPYPTIRDATDATSAGAVIALARGTYEEVVVLEDGHALIGACTAQTRIAPLRFGVAGSVMVSAGEATVRNVSITGPNPGIGVADGTDVTVEDVVIEEATLGGIFVDGGRLTARRSIIRGTTSGGSAGLLGMGVFVRGGGEAELSEVLLDDNALAGALALESAITLRDVTVRDTREQDNDGFLLGASLVGYAGSTLTATDAVFERSATAGVIAFDAGTTAVLDNVVVRDTRASSRGEFGRGVIVGFGAALTANRLTIAGASDQGLIVHGASTATVTDAIVSDVGPQPMDGRFGGGITVQGQSALTLSRVAIQRFHDTGVAAFDSGTLAMVSDLLVLEATGISEASPTGTGIHVQGAALSGERVDVQMTRGAGLAALVAGTVTLTDTSITDVAELECVVPDCMGRTLGDGFEAILDGHVTLERFLIARCARAGFVIAEGGAADLSNGRIEQCPIGANIQSEGFDEARISDGVIFDTTRNLDRTGLPLVQPMTPTM